MTGMTAKMISFNFTNSIIPSLPQCNTTDSLRFKGCTNSHCFKGTSDSSECKNFHLIANMFPSVAEYHFFFVSLQPKYNS